MKFKHFWLAALVCGFIFAACFVAAAAESGEAGEKPADEPAAEDTEGEKAEAEKAKTPLEQRLLNLYDALLKFTQEHNRLTPLRIDQLTTYLKEAEKGLLNPETDKPLVMNAKMRGVHEGLIEKPETFITFYAEKDTKDKGRAVVYGDKALKYLTPKQLREGLAASAPKRLSAEDRFERMQPGKTGPRPHR